MQTKLFGSKPADFQIAIEEAILADSGYVQTVAGAEPKTSPQTNHSEMEEASGSNLEQEFSSLDQARSKGSLCSFNCKMQHSLC